MLEFFREGGFGMFPVAIFGLVMIVAAARYAFDPDPTHLRTTKAIGAVLGVTTLHAMLTDVAAVFAHVSDPAICPDDEVLRHTFVGLMESTRPGALGGALLALALVFAAVGVAREGQQQRRRASV